MTHLGIAAALLVVAVSTASANPAQQVREEQLPALLNEQLRAAELYREGRVDEAFRIFDARRPSLNERLAQLAASSLTRPLKLKVEEGMQGPRPWTQELVRALAALHMEAALRTYERQETVGRFRTEAAAAARLFSALDTPSDYPAEDWSRWIVAIGLTALSDGQLWWASEILAQTCGHSVPLPALLLACGSLHEAIAALPAHILLSQGHQSSTAIPEFGVRSYQDADARRRRHLGMARRYFENAVRLNTGDTEARLRLAWVHFVSGEAHTAAGILETLLNGEPLDRRAAFLVRLFLGRARQDSGDLAGAVALYREALTIAPSAQSAHVALAAALHRQGAVREATAVTRQLFDAPSEPLDPWTSYHYGQFWSIQSLLTTLRSEARR
ncbi:MAG TPA: tetratricopeptide repeat protein [Vicinamibacterales bacterium]